jgi:hypothetical protein
MSKTIQATVKVMLSYDYCHFEVSKTIEPDDFNVNVEMSTSTLLKGLTQKEIDEARKDCQRLADKAVGQYKKAKEMAIKRTGNSYERMQLEKEVLEINKKKDEFLTEEDKAKIKALEDYNHAAKYNYMDDEDYVIDDK